MLYSILYLVLGLSASNFALPHYQNEDPILISAVELQQKKDIYSIIKTSKSCQIHEFHMTFVPKGKDPFMKVNRQEGFNDFIKNRLQTIQKGDWIYLDNVKSLGNCLEYQGKGHTRFVIKVI